VSDTTRIRPPPKQKPLREGTEAALEKQHATDMKSTTAPFAVVVINRSGKRVTWRRFGSYAGALAEARHLREKGIACAVEPPAS
jgi:hypothetical protein